MNQQPVILVVEDEEKSRRFMEALLVSMGFVPRLAADGQEALEKLKERSGADIDLVLLDVMMPRVNGFEVLKEMRQTPRLAELPVIMTTALSGKEDRLQAVEAGANDYVGKPIDKLELKVRMASQLKIKQAQDARRQLLRETVKGSIRILADVLAILKPGIYGRVTRMIPIIRQLSDAMADPQPWMTETAAMLGMLGAVIHSEALNRRINDGEDIPMDDAGLYAEQISLASRLVGNIPRLEPVAEIIAYQDKHFDGSGLPRDEAQNRQEESIPLGSRIIKVAGDYQQAIDDGQDPVAAISAMKQRQGVHDPAIIKALQRILGAQAAYEIVNVPLDKLKVGMIAEQDVMASQSGMAVKLISKGQEIDEAMRAYLAKNRPNKTMQDLNRTLRVRMPVAT